MMLAEIFSCGEPNQPGWWKVEASMRSDLDCGPQFAIRSCGPDAERELS